MHERERERRRRRRERQGFGRMSVIAARVSK